MDKLSSLSFEFLRISMDRPGVVRPYTRPHVLMDSPKDPQPQVSMDKPGI